MVVNVACVRLAVFMDWGVALHVGGWKCDRVGVGVTGPVRNGA